MSTDPGYQFTKIGADAERAARKAAEDNLPVDMMNDRRMQSYAGLWAIIGAKAAATVVLAEARAQFEQDIADAEKRGAAKALQRINDDLLNYRDELRELRGSHTRWALGVEEAAGEIRRFATQVESGEVTL